MLFKFPVILDTVFFWEDFFILVELEIAENKRKVGIFENGEKKLIILDNIIKFKKYNYKNLPP